VRWRRPWQAILSLPTTDIENIAKYRKFGIKILSQKSIGNTFIDISFQKIGDKTIDIEKVVAIAVNVSAILDTSILTSLVFQACFLDSLLYFSRKYRYRYRQ